MYKNIKELEETYYAKTKNYKGIGIQLNTIKDYERVIRIFNENGIENHCHGILYAYLPDGINLNDLKVLYLANIWFKLV